MYYNIHYNILNILQYITIPQNGHLVYIKSLNYWTAYTTTAPLMFIS